MPLSRWQPPVLRRDAEEEHRVTWLELFFDLVFVASLIQLGNVLADDLTLGGAVRFVALFVALWWNWSGTTVFVNRVAVDDWKHRVLVITQMFAVGSLAVHVPVAFEAGELGFALSYIAARATLVAMWAHARDVVPEARALASRFMGLFLLGIGLWSVSLLVPAPARYWLWALAIVVEAVGTATPAIRGQFDSSTHGEIEHLQERMALFTIIVLGEGFVKATDVLTDSGVSAPSLVYGVLGITIMGAIWWTYFDDVADAVVRRDGMWTYVWSYGHAPLAAAITAFGVSLKKLLALEGYADAIATDKAWLLGASVVVTMLATAVLDLATRPSHFAVDTNDRVVPRLAAAAATLGLTLAAGAMPALAFVAGVAVVAVVQIAWEVRVAVRADRWVSEQVEGALAGSESICEHLTSIPARRADRLECADCVAHGEHWVELRLCVTCGHVGCCDDSPGRHATAHHEATAHPVIRSLESHAHWAWCFLDEETLEDWRPRRVGDAH